MCSYALRTQPLHINASPFEFHLYASEFLVAARAIPLSRTFSPVRYFLYCRAIELALKAFLLASGVGKSALTKKDKFGHNLVRGLDWAKERGLHGFISVTEMWAGELRKANAYYDSKAFEHFDVGKAARGYSDLPSLKVLDEFAASLLANTESVCRSV